MDIVSDEFPDKKSLYTSLKDLSTFNRGRSWLIRFFMAMICLEAVVSLHSGLGDQSWTSGLR